jgi:hypothetical protein
MLFFPIATGEATDVASIGVDGIEKREYAGGLVIMAFRASLLCALVGLLTLLPIGTLHAEKPTGKCCATCNGSCGSVNYYRKCRFCETAPSGSSQARGDSDKKRSGSSGGLASRVAPVPTGFIMPWTYPVMPMMAMPFATPAGFQSRSGPDEYRGETRGQSRCEQIEEELDEIRKAFIRVETLLRGQQEVLGKLTDRVQALEKGVKVE